MEVITLLYLVEVLGGINILAVIALAAFTFVGALLLVLSDNPIHGLGHRWVKPVVIGICVSTLTLLSVPSKKTAYAIAIAYIQKTNSTDVNSALPLIKQLETLSK